MKIGDKTEQVKLVQGMLRITADGIFGPKTESAVREFQRKFSIPINGIVDTVTLHMLYIQYLNLQRLSDTLPQSILDQIPHTAEKFGINSALRLSHFLAQCGHESGNFRLVVENLNYSESGLLSVFRKYFNTDTAKQYARNPERIANRVYANRMGNGDEASGDGWKYRGRGYIQLTGKSNYAAFNSFVDENVVSNPDLVAIAYPLVSAGWFFHTNKLWAICDRGNTVEVVSQLTRRVNGGLNGLDDRVNKFNQYYKILVD